MSKIGEILKKEREAKNLSIKSICEETKIREKVIVAIENEDYSIMPEVYLRSFIKVYADYLNVNIENIKPKEKLDEKKNLKFEQDEEIAQPKFNFKPAVEIDHKVFSAKRFQNFNKQKIINLLVATAIFLAVIALLILAFYPQEHSQNETNAIKKDTLSIKPENNGLLSSFSNQNNGDSIRLEAISSDSSWVYIDIDGVARKEALLVPKEKKEWRAFEFFVLTVGNAGAVKFYRNGEELPSFGGYGKVARGVKITRNDFITPQKQLDKSDTVKKKN